MAGVTVDPHAHPDRLATVAALHGLAAPDPRTSRVLELGCGAGANLLAIAAAAPGVRALGVELAAEPVAEGRLAIAELGLTSVELRRADVCALTEGELGEFDYVLVGGPAAGDHLLAGGAPAGDAVLAACHAHLAADGLACVPSPLAGRAAAGHGLAFVGDAAPGWAVLCRDSRTAASAIDRAALRGLHFAADGDASTGGRDALLASALALLRARAPDTIGFRELRAALAAEPDALAAALLAGLRAELVVPHATPLRAVRAAEIERPAASPLTRRQARHGPEVTSLAHTVVRMEEPAARLLLTLLDGTRTRPAIRAEFGERTGVRLSPEDLDANLDRLGRLFLLAEVGGV